MMTWKTALLTCVTLANLRPAAMTSVVTSYEKLLELAVHGDRPLVQAIQKTIEEDLVRIKKCLTILTEHMKNDQPLYELRADHPNDFYLLVKHYVKAWSSDTATVLDEVIHKENLTFPTTEELGDAVRALIYIQYVYKLKARDMFEGDYLGYKGSPLTTEDAYLLGHTAFSAPYRTQDVEWLELSAELLAKEQKNRSDASIEDREEYIMTLALLGRAYLYANDTDKARQMYDQCIASGLTYFGDVEALLEELKAVEAKGDMFDFQTDATQYENVSVLCSREKEHRVSALRPYHVCRYKSDIFVPYRRFREEILSLSPYVSLFYDVIHDVEIVQMTRSAKQKLKRARIAGGGGAGRITHYRTGNVAWLSDHQHPFTARVSQRVQAFTRLDVTKRQERRPSSAEDLQLVNYGIGGHYDLHLDAFWVSHTQNSGRRMDMYSDRIATVLFYLTDVEKGGATIFPNLGVSVSPVKGMALLWYNYRPDMNERDQDTLHAGCPVVIGNKWIANKWIWTYGNTFRRPCGPSPTSQQLEVESLVSIDTLKQIIP